MLSSHSEAQPEGAAECGSMYSYIVVRQGSLVLGAIKSPRFSMLGPWSTRAPSSFDGTHPDEGQMIEYLQATFGITTDDCGVTPNACRQPLLHAPDRRSRVRDTKSCCRVSRAPARRCVLLLRKAVFLVLFFVLRTNHFPFVRLGVLRTVHDQASYFLYF